MSLSFVKSAVLSSSDGISHNEETSINNPETTSLRSRTNTAAKPLFEQLRANKEAEQEAQDEFQRSLRGTRMLDDEDCAHLDAVERVREEREQEVKSGIEREVALFRARREDRGLVQSVVGDTNGEEAEDDGIVKERTQKKDAIKAIVPKFTIKKKRRRVGSESNDQVEKPATSVKTLNDEIDTRIDTSVEMDEVTSETNADKAASTSNMGNNSNSGNVSGLLGLGCYGSDSEDD